MSIYSTILDIATALGTQAGEGSDPYACDDLRQSAEYLRRCQENGVQPERLPYGYSEEFQALLLLCQSAGFAEAGMCQLRAAYSNAAHDAEDAAIMDEADDIEAASNLIDISTGDIIREATMDERWASALAARRDSGRGAISVDGLTCYAG